MNLELVGIIGGLAFLVGFLEVSIGRWDGQSRRYEALNLLGAVFLGYYSFQKHAYTNIVLNMVWGTVALYTIFHAVQRHRVRKSRKIAAKRTRKK